LTILKVGTNGSTDSQVQYDPFSMNPLTQAIPTTAYNPYEDSNNVRNNGAGYYQAQPSFSAPAQPVGQPVPNNFPANTPRHNITSMLQWVHIEKIFWLIRSWFTTFSSAITFGRICKRSLPPLSRFYQVSLSLQKDRRGTDLSDSQLPILDHYHTLVPLDTNHNKNAAVFGYPSWVYKAISSKNGNVYVLRRLEGNAPS
jgi:PAB-dependent poly(A)-specific ribonuclease subunit 3